MAQLKEVTLPGNVNVQEELEKNKYNIPVGTVSNLLHVNVENPYDFCNESLSISTEDASTLVNSPVTSGAFYGYREVLLIKNHNNYFKAVVRITESYPVGGRIWTNAFNPDNNSWTGWEYTAFDNKQQSRRLDGTTDKVLYTTLSKNTFDNLVFTMHWANNIDMVNVTLWALTSEWKHIGEVTHLNGGSVPATVYGKMVNNVVTLKFEINSGSGSALLNIASLSAGIGFSPLRTTE